MCLPKVKLLKFYPLLQVPHLPERAFRREHLKALTHKKLRLRDDTLQWELWFDWVQNRKCWKVSVTRDVRLLRFGQIPLNLWFSWYRSAGTESIKGDTIPQGGCSLLHSLEDLLSQNRILENWLWLCVSVLPKVWAGRARLRFSQLPCSVSC